MSPWSWWQRWEEQGCHSVTCGLTGAQPTLGGRRGLGLAVLGASKEPAWEASEVGTRGETLRWANTGWIFIPSPRRSLGSERWEGKEVPGLVLRRGVFAASNGREERRTERQEEWQGACVLSAGEGDVIGDVGGGSPGITWSGGAWGQCRARPGSRALSDSGTGSAVLNSD